MMRLKIVGMRLRMAPIIPPRKPPELNCRDACRVPVEGSVELQLERGVLTTSLQVFSRVDNSVSNGFKTMANTPLLLVTALEMTLLPQTSCTVASAIQTMQTNCYVSAQY